ncbi:hypothetical protein CYY_002774 [Polysphondylium violaceum]|uniref:SNF2-related domain-containing protein n=1 Tax=Polysphondylium violaceum TaxID=133409 RepID=A0A8J4Q7J6_9MYCE|nr:hypothetical protein CYY_002774 [Polysphondylium violaceum]
MIRRKPIPPQRRQPVKVISESESEEEEESSQSSSSSEEELPPPKVKTLSRKISKNLHINNNNSNGKKSISKSIVIESESESESESEEEEQEQEEEVEEEEDQEQEEEVEEEKEDEEESEQSETESEEEVKKKPKRRLIKQSKRVVVSESESEQESEEEEESEQESEEGSVYDSSSEEEQSSDFEQRKKKSTNKSNSKPSKLKFDDSDTEEEEDNNSTTGKEDILEDQKNGFIKNVNKKLYINSTKSKQGKEFSMRPNVYEGLFWYQREGINWLWKLFCKGAGGILGDDMGLGKTLQIVSFLHSMHSQHHIQKTLLVMPVSLIEHWIKEFDRLKPKFLVKVYHGSSVRDREDGLEDIKDFGGVCITTYGMVSSNPASLNTHKRKQFAWDYIILDEGHKIKETKTKISKTIREIPSTYKIIMTGTAIQNNLRELWSLFDWVCQGTLLGTIRHFTSNFEKAILKSHHSDSSQSEKKIGSAIAENLRNIISPYFLRREKKDVFNTTNKNNGRANNDKALPTNTLSNPIDLDADAEDKENLLSNSNVQISSTTTTTTTTTSSSKDIVQGITTQKNDFVVWSKMAEPQIQLYKTFLESEEVKNALNKTASPLAALTVLKKICDHPLLLNQEMMTCDFDDMKTLMSASSQTDIKSIIRNSGKMQILFYLLQNLKTEGHRTLIFSQSVKMLNSIQSLLEKFDYQYLRIDGSINNTKERQRRIDLFNQDTSYFCFLLTIQVGALGINLTSADRVIIFDPSWNTVDNQAVDRVYRIGQKRDVVVYRLITCGTIEEKIYRKQVFKGSLMKTMLDQSQGQHRYFSHSELRELFTLGDTNVSNTQIQLESLHSSRRKTTPELENHLKFISKVKMIFGVSDHDLLFSEQVHADHNEQDLQELLEKGIENVNQTKPSRRSRRKNDDNNDNNNKTPSKRPTKKMGVTIISDTPKKTQSQGKKFIYLDGESEHYEEDLQVIDDNEINPISSDDDDDNARSVSPPPPPMSKVPSLSAPLFNFETPKKDTKSTDLSMTESPIVDLVSPVKQVLSPEPQPTKHKLSELTIGAKRKGRDPIQIELDEDDIVENKKDAVDVDQSTTNDKSFDYKERSHSNRDITQQFNQLLDKAKQVEGKDQTSFFNYLLDALDLVGDDPMLEKFIQNKYKESKM